MRSRIQFIQFLANAAMMACMIVIPILAKTLGASDFIIGLSVTVYFLMFFISSVVSGALADKFGPKRFVCWGLIIASVFFALQVFINNIYSLILIRAFVGWATGLFPAALAAYAFQERQGKMGRFAAYGSLGWALGAIIVTVVSAYKPMFFMAAVFLFFAFVFSLNLKEDIKPLEKKAIPWQLLKQDLRIYLAYFLRNTGAHMAWVIFPLFLLELGVGYFWVGLMFFIHTFPQFFFMQYVEKFDNRKLIMWGVLISIVAFAGFGFSPYWIFLLPFQVLVALSFSCLQVGVFQEILHRNKEKSTVAGILTGVWNLAAVVGPFFGGMISHFYGYRGNMFGAAGVIAVGFFILVPRLYKKRL